MSTPSPPRSARCDSPLVIPAKAGILGREAAAPFIRRGLGLRRGDVVELYPDHLDLELDLDRYQGPARHGAAGLVGQLPFPDRRHRDARPRPADGGEPVAGPPRL